MSEPTFTVSQLSSLTRLDRRRVAMLLASAPVAKMKGTVRHYSLGDALPLLCLPQEDSDAATRAKVTKEKSCVIDFQNREFDQLKRLREVALLSHCTAYVQEERIAFRQVVARAEFLNDSQKERILERCKAIKISKPEPIEA